MFSYRHAFHAGNHADVLKHLVLLATLRHLVQKDTPLAVFDTHAGAGLYRLDSDFSATSGEAGDGILRLLALPGGPPPPAKAARNANGAAAARTATTAAAAKSPKATPSPKPPESAAPKWCDTIQDYLDVVARFNRAGAKTIYPGSPFIIQDLLRERDKLKLFELHPTDGKNLTANIAQLEAGRQIAVLREDGFEGTRRMLPPPQRRALVICDPSYEMKTDYAQVAQWISDALERFAVGTYLVWYPIIPRPEAHGLPRRLRTLADKARRPWLNASLTVKGSKITRLPDGREQRPGLPASGMFVINPPFTLRAQLAEALPQLVAALGQDRHAAYAVDSSG